MIISYWTQLLQLNYSTSDVYSSISNVSGSISGSAENVPGKTIKMDGITYDVSSVWKPTELPFDDIYEEAKAGNSTSSVNKTGIAAFWEKITRKQNVFNKILFKIMGKPMYYDRNSKGQTFDQRGLFINKYI